MSYGRVKMICIYILRWKVKCPIKHIYNKWDLDLLPGEMFVAVLASSFKCSGGWIQQKCWQWMLTLTGIDCLLGSCSREGRVEGDVRSGRDWRRSCCYLDCSPGWSVAMQCIIFSNRPCACEVYYACALPAHPELSGGVESPLPRRG